MKKIVGDNQLKLSGKAWQIRYMLRELRRQAPQDGRLHDYLRQHSEAWRQR